MKLLYNALLLAILSIASLTASAQQIKDPALSRMIDSLASEDQKPAKLPSDQGPAAFQKVIRTNFPRVKQIMQTYGFPGISLVGEESAHHYWMLVQHSDFDLGFQKKVLKAMKKKLDKHDASGQDYAYLVDRIELHEGRPQIYGTQVNMGPGGTKVKPTIDMPNLDKRRQAVGLEPIADYLKRNDEIFKALNNGTLDKLEDSLKKQQQRP